MPKYILDTNIFYTISGNKSQRNKIVRKLQDVKQDLIITPLNILEIANFDGSEEDYHKRKAAMNVINDLNVEIYQDSSDEIITKAFGLQPEQAFTQIELQNIIYAVVHSKGLKNFGDGVFKIEGDKITAHIRLFPKILNKWKKDARKFFNDKINEGNKEIQKDVKETLEFQNGEMEKRVFRQLKKASILKSINSEIVYAFMLIGLAERAGKLVNKEYEDLVDNFDINKFIRLLTEILEVYDNSLEEYITVYLLYRYKTLYGKHPEKNDLFDLEFFSYLNVIEDSIFVTNEDLWITIDKENELGNVLSYSEFYNTFLK